MNVFSKLFNTKKAFVAYLTAGVPDLAYTVQAACALAKGGVDILEIGVPFSDPIADGPIIQAAMEMALEKNVTLNDTLNAIKEIKKQISIPIVLFTYFNLLLVDGLAVTMQAAKAAGVDAILVVDLPLEESSDYFAACQAHAIEPIGLLAPTTSLTRIKMVSQHNNSFLYYVCRNGVTGVKSALPDDFIQNLERIKSQTNLPVVTGFGIGNKTLAARALQHCAGFVVGSQFMQAIQNGATANDLQNLATAIDPR